MFRRIIIFFTTILLVIGVAGCNASEGGQEEATEGKTTESNESNDQATQDSGSESADQSNESEEDKGLETTYPLTLTDATGTEVTFDSEPTKLVSLIPSETETLFALGAGEEVLAVDDFSNYPAETKELPKLGSTYSGLNIEELIALSPDVVFINAQLQPEVAEKLRKKDLKVFASNPESIKEIIVSIQTMGTILNNQKEANEVTDEMNQELNEVKDKVAKVEPKKIYAEYSEGWTFGSGEFANDMITLAGGKNIFADQEGWFDINPEEVIKRDPEVILYTEGAEGENKQRIVTRDGWDVINAVKNDRVIGINSNKASRVGPRITDSLVEIFESIHPELAE